MLGPMRVVNPIVASAIQHAARSAFGAQVHKKVNVGLRLLYVYVSVCVDHTPPKMFAQQIPKAMRTRYIRCTVYRPSQPENKRLRRLARLVALHPITSIQIRTNFMLHACTHDVQRASIGGMPTASVSKGSERCRLNSGRAVQKGTDSRCVFLL